MALCCSLTKIPNIFEWIVKFAFPFSLIRFDSLSTQPQEKRHGLVEVAITVNSYPKNGNKFPLAKFNCVLSIRVFCDTHSSGFFHECQRERMPNTLNANNIEEHRSYSLLRFHSLTSSSSTKIGAVDAKMWFTLLNRKPYSFIHSLVRRIYIETSSIGLSFARLNSTE